MMKLATYIWLILFTVLLFAAPPVLAVPDASHTPIEVTSEQMEALSAPRRVVFIGSVVATQGDLVIYADRMTIHFQEPANEVSRILAEGRVRMVQGDRVATGDSAIFHRDEQTVILRGSPRVYQGRDFVEGDEITVYLQEDRSVVTSREGVPARAIFHPRGEAP
jgi:lipopolysaccharide export system protein LptA